MYTFMDIQTLEMVEVALQKKINLKCIYIVRYMENSNLRNRPWFSIGHFSPAVEAKIMKKQANESSFNSPSNDRWFNGHPSVEMDEMMFWKKIDP